MARTERITSSEAKAQLLLARSAAWSRGTAVTATGETVGVVLFASATRPGVVYLTRCDGRGGCTCPAYQRGNRECCHIRAVQADAAAARSAAGRSLEDLWGDHLDEGTRPLVDAF